MLILWRTATNKLMCGKHSCVMQLRTHIGLDLVAQHLGLVLMSIHSGLGNGLS